MPRLSSPVSSALKRMHVKGRAAELAEPLLRSAYHGQRIACDGRVGVGDRISTVRLEFDGPWCKRQISGARLVEGLVLSNGSEAVRKVVVLSEGGVVERFHLSTFSSMPVLVEPSRQGPSSSETR